MVQVAGCRSQTAPATMQVSIDNDGEETRFQPANVA
jgi:hypothetical protein